MYDLFIAQIQIFNLLRDSGKSALGAQRSSAVLCALTLNCNSVLAPCLVLGREMHHEAPFGWLEVVNVEIFAVGGS